MGLAPAIKWVKDFRKTGKQDTFSTLFGRDTKVAIIDPAEVGIIAAHLIVQDDVSVHDRAKYALSGPEDITGKQIVELMERDVGEKISNVRYADSNFFEHLAKQGMPQNRIAGMKTTLQVLLDGGLSVSSMPTSEAVLRLVAPKITPEEAFRAMLEG
jgi:hypothetical protein